LLLSPILSGKLKFKVSKGDTLIIEPGTVLVAEDCKGKGHSWDLVDGYKKDRILKRMRSFIFD
jgi:hypothetical protein